MVIFTVVDGSTSHGLGYKQLGATHLPVRQADLLEAKNARVTGILISHGCAQGGRSSMDPSCSCNWRTLFVLSFRFLGQSVEQGVVRDHENPAAAVPYPTFLASEWESIPRAKIMR